MSCSLILCCWLASNGPCAAWLQLVCDQRLKFRSQWCRLFLLSLCAGRTTGDMQRALTQQVEALASSYTPEEDIARVKKAIRVSLLVRMLS